MNADRTVISTHRFVTTPQTARLVTSRPRSSGSITVHWNASWRVLSIFTSSGWQSSSFTTSASHEPAQRPLAWDTGESLISGRKAFQRPMAEGAQLLQTIQDVYLDSSITIA